MFLEFEASVSKSDSRDRVLINLKKHSISIAVNTYTVFTYDLSGRLITAFMQGHTFRRSLENQVMEKWSRATSGGQERRRTWLNHQRSKKLLDDVHREVQRIHKAIQSDHLNIIDSSASDGNIQDEIVHALDKVLAYDFSALEKDAAQVFNIYDKIGILPPDMYLSLILQATEGCSYNRCNYCSFYHNQPFKLKTDPEFRNHIRKVKQYFGESIRLRKSIFLGEANAFDMPQKRLLAFFNILHEQFDFTAAAKGSVEKPCMSGVYGFATGFAKKKRSPSDFAELQQLGLRRIYIGMETGSSGLLRFLNKPLVIDNLIPLIHAVKAGGVHIGIIILLGAGGKKWQDEHVRETVSAVRAMELGRNDIVFFSPVVDSPENDYGKALKRLNSVSLHKTEMNRQKERMLKGFNFRKGHGSPKIAIYDIGEFLY